MRLAILSFAAGIVCLQHQAQLPHVHSLLWLASGGLLLFVVGWRLPPARRPACALAAFLLGLAWAGWRADVRLADQLREVDEGRDIEVVGVVATLPQAFERGLRFEFDVEHAASPVPSRVALSWYRGMRNQDDDDFHAAPALQAGERWRLVVRLKRPHGNVNPHGFDYEGWLLERNIRAVGYVRKTDANVRLSELVARPAYLVQRVRQTIRERFQDRLDADPYGGILVALAVGDQRAIDPAYWRIFARTGVTHLLSVSGLHVTMVAGLAAWLAGWGWRRVPGLALRLPAQKASALAGFAAAFAYALLAGFEVPAQRTLYMLSVVALALWSGRQLAASRVLALALLLVLLLDPWAVLAAGFWLSFGAVGCLFYVGGGRLRQRHWLVNWGVTQWAVTVGMLPALLALFQQFSLVSPLANAVAIPLVSLVITPLALLAIVPGLGGPLLGLAGWLTAWLMRFLEWLAASDWAVWQQHAPPTWAVVLGLFGAAWLLLPKGFTARWLGALAMLPLIAVPVERPASGTALVRVIDVGQGLAVHVQTAGHDLLYDAGPAYSADADAGDRVVVPYLRAMGVGHLDALVVSHQDKDHEGGAAAVLTAIPVGRMVTSLAETHPLRLRNTPHQRCLDGQHWEWDGVSFDMLNPVAADYEHAAKSNALSCVLKVTAAGHAILLTGDIEARTEQELVARAGSQMQSDVLVPPHHGSRSSSSEEFLGVVSPRLTFISAGYRNRFGHPAPEVVERYERIGAEMLRTDRDGALTVFLDDGALNAHGERSVDARYWRAADRLSP